MIKRAQVKRLSLVVSMMAIAAVFCLACRSAEAAPRGASEKVLEVWPGQRVVMFLPMTLGTGWNVDHAFGEALLADVAQNLQDLLVRSGKFSIIEPYRFNPILQRSLVERRLSSDDVTKLVTGPSLQTARVVMSKIDKSFDQAPLIGEFTLEEVRLSGTGQEIGVQVQVSGRLFAVSAEMPMKSSIVTSNTVSGGGRIADKVVSAAQDAFTEVVAEFVKPIAEPTFTIEASPLPATAPTVPAGTTANVTRVAPGSATAPTTSKVR